MKTFLLSLIIIPLILVSFLPQRASALDLIPCNGGVVSYDSAGNAQTDFCTWNDLLVLVNNVIDFIIYTVITVWAGIVIMWAGFLLLTSGGNPGKRGKAKSMLLNLLIGIIIILIAWLIIHEILTAVGCTDCLKLIG